ncbi:hypothetical protein K439DRAFT_1625643, partial [Ramaria rubella]
MSEQPMPIVWIYPYAMEVRQVSFRAWSTGSCIGGFADIRDILRYVCLSTSTLKGMDTFNVITHAIFFLSDPIHLVCVRSCRGMAHIHQHQVPHTRTCTVAATAACMWNFTSCLRSYKDTRYVDTSIVKPEGKSGWPEVATAWPISTSTMYHTHLHALLLPT